MVQKARDAANYAKGSILVWLAGLVFGIGAGVVFAYHILHASAPGPLPELKVNQAIAAQVTIPQVHAVEMERAHREALAQAGAKRKTEKADVPERDLPETGAATPPPAAETATVE